MESRPRATHCAMVRSAESRSLIRIWPAPWITGTLLWNHTEQSVNFWIGSLFNERMDIVAMFTFIVNSRLPLTFAMVLLGLILPFRIFGQVDTGAISGTIKDTSGGTIAGARVTLTNEGTGVSITT